MTNTIDTAAAELHITTSEVIALVDQISDDSTLWDSDTETITDTGMDVLRSQIFGTLTDYNTGDAIRTATRDELIWSIQAQQSTGGAGCYTDDETGLAVYVDGGDVDAITADDILNDGSIWTVSGPDATATDL